jgi:hypothetical protein
MRDKKAGPIIGFLSLLISSALLSCSTDTTQLQIENSLPQIELAYYSDTFDNMREDLWDRAGYLYREQQLHNFKQAEMRFENSKLIIRTRTGSFSKGGLSSRFALRGDFDIRLACRTNFKPGISGMDQLVGLGVFDQSLKKNKITNATIGLSIRAGSDQGYLISNSIFNGKRRSGNSRNSDNFNGIFRIKRNGKYISTLYKRNGAVEWSKLNTFHLTDNDMLIGFMVQNFFRNRTNIQAKHPISVELDSFIISSAQKIIEDEI